MHTKQECYQETIISKTDNTENKTKSTVMHKRIGSMVYEVVIHFNPNANETLNDKKLRLIRRDLEAAS